MLGSSVATTRCMVLVQKLWTFVGSLDLVSHAISTTGALYFKGLKYKSV